MYSVPYAKLKWIEGVVPFSSEFDDIYYPSENPLQQTQAVFLEGNTLLQRWTKDTFQGPPRNAFVIGELGFGTGLNFLATLHLWRKTVTQSAHLYYVAFESNPLSITDLQKALAPFSEFSSEVTHLLNSYPPPLRGSHRLSFPQYQATLDLVLGDANETIQRQLFLADAWYFDGFNPASNSELWNPELFEILRTKSHSETTFATYSSAGWLRRALESVGCLVTKVKHTEGKRETIRGVFKSARQKLNVTKIKRASIIGGGYAGVTLAYTLATRGVSVHIYEQESRICSKASGNPQGVILPYISRKPSAASSLYLPAFLYARQQLAHLERHSDSSLFNTAGIIHFPSTARLAALLNELETLMMPPEIARRIESTELCNILGTSIQSPAFFYELGGWIQPSSVAKTMLNEHGNLIDVITNSSITSEKLLTLEKESDVVIYANAFEAAKLFDSSDLPVEAVRGQLAFIDESQHSTSLEQILCYDGYLLPSQDGKHLLGASYDHGSYEETPREHENGEMLRNLCHWTPELFSETAQATTARVAFRTSTRDRLPIVGSITSQEDISPNHAFFIGFGSRGLSSIPLLAQQLTSSLLQEPQPLSAAEAKAVNANRFQERRLKKES